MNLDHEELNMVHDELNMDHDELDMDHRELNLDQDQPILDCDKSILNDKELDFDDEGPNLDKDWSISEDDESILDKEQPILDYDLEYKPQQWSAYSLRHQPADHDAAIAMHSQLFAEVEAIVPAQMDSQVEIDMLEGDPANERSALLELSGIGAQFFADDGSAIASEQLKTTEDIVLGKLFDLTLSRAISRGKHGEFAPQTMQCEVRLATELYKINHFEEAEYHLRRLLHRYTPSVVPLRLGMLLLFTARPEESVELLFLSLSTFIVEFPRSSTDENSVNFDAINFLFADLARFGALGVDWGTLEFCMHEMTATIQKSFTQSTIDQIFPKLLIHGFSMARECSQVGILEPAKDLYRVLLPHCHRLDDPVYEVAKASAHQTYGVLLRGEQNWISSAKQLLLALQYTTNLVIHDTLLEEILIIDYNELLPHLVDTDGEEKSLLKELREQVAKIQSNPFLRSPGGDSETLGHPRQEESPSSLDLLLAPGRWVLPFPRQNSTANRAEGDHTSTTSGDWRSTETRPGVTYTVGSGVTDIGCSSSDYCALVA
jgi:hypothetical protein